MARYDSIKDICADGLDLRVWCYRCGRGEKVCASIWEKFEARGWSMSIDEARPRFRCRLCRSSADTLVLPTKPISPLPSFASGASIVEWFFHGRRTKRRR